MRELTKLLLQLKWCAWAAVYCAFISFASSRSSEDTKQMLSSFMYVFYSLVCISLILALIRIHLIFIMYIYLPGFEVRLWFSPLTVMPRLIPVRQCCRYYDKYCNQSQHFFERGVDQNQFFFMSNRKVMKFLLIFLIKIHNSLLAVAARQILLHSQNQNFNVINFND